MQLTNENYISTELIKWFQQYDIDVWNNNGDNKFTTELSQKKPDLIIYSKKLQKYIAIEVKHGTTNRSVHDSIKIIEYYKDYNEKKIKYFINKKEINISSFAVATYYSKYGKLFGKEDTFIKKDNFDKYSQFILKYRTHPLHEYAASHAYIRTLWSQWRIYKQKQVKKETWNNMPGIGCILSNILNQDVIDNQNIITHPIIFEMKWLHNKYKPRWGVRTQLL